MSIGFKQDARPLSATICVIGVIIAGCMDAVGYPLPTEIVAFLLAYPSEYAIERAIRKRKAE